MKFQNKIHEVIYSCEADKIKAAVNEIWKEHKLTTYPQMFKVYRQMGGVLRASSMERLARKMAKSGELVRIYQGQTPYFAPIHAGGFKIASTYF
jgi:hypothetical protein